MTEDPKESLRTTMATHSRDWSACERDAWAYGIVLGWPDNALAELAKDFRWSTETVARLRRLHTVFVGLS